MNGTDCPVVDIQSGAGRMKSCSQANSYARTIANTENHDAAETLLKFQWDNNTAKAVFRVFIRASEDWDSSWTPTRAYEVLVNNNGGYTVNRITTGSRTQIGTGSWTADTNAWWIRFRAVGNDDIRFKIWADSGSEPVAWNETIDDSVSGFTDAGVLQLSLNTETAGAEHTLTLDDISYHNPVETDNQPAYINGALAGTPASDSQPAYLAGSLAASDNQAAYMAGSIDASDSQAAYMQGRDTAVDNQPAYIQGRDTAVDNQPAYMQGRDTASDNQSAFMIGGAKVETLFDDFNDNSRDTGKWNLGSSNTSDDNASVTTLEQNTRLEIQPLDSTAGLNFYGYKSVDLFSLIGSQAFVECPQTGSSSGNNTQITLMSGATDGDNKVAIEIDGGTIYFRYRGTSNSDETLTYSSTDHRWLRIRHENSSGNVLWETSPEGAVWTTRRTVAASTIEAAGVDLTALRAHLQAGTWQSVSSPVATYFDNFNIVQADDNQPAYIVGGINVSDNQSAFMIGGAKVETLFDDFNDNTRDTAKWDLGSHLSSIDDPNVTTDEANGRLEIQIPDNDTGYYGYKSVNQYSIIDSAAFAEMEQVPTQNNEGNANFILQAGAANYQDVLAIYVNVTTISFEYKNGNTPSKTTTTYNASTMRWWRFRHDNAAGNILWETSADGLSWTTRRTVARSNITFDLGALRVHMDSGSWGNVTGQDQTQIPNFNIVNAVDNVPAYMAGGIDVSDNQSAYMAGVDTASDNQPAYTAGGINVSDNQPAYMEGGGTAAVDNQAAYMQGQDTATDNQPAYMAGSLDIVDNQAAFTAGGVNVLDNQAAYMQGRDTAIDNQAAYMAGSINVSDNQAAYMQGRDTAVDNQPAYTAGGINVSDNQAAYMAGVAGASDNKSAYMAGVDTAVDNQPAYLAGVDTASDNQPAYLAGVDTAVDNRSAFMAGSLAAVASQPAYMQGSQADSASQPAYMAGGVNVSDNQAAYMEGVATAADNKAAYIEGLTYFPFTEDFTGQTDEDPWRISHWTTSTG
jgi:hypothetical protein